MSKLFRIKNFIIIELSILLLVIVSFIIKIFGLPPQMFGECAPRGAGLVDISYCQQIYGSIGLWLFSIIFIAYLIIFIIYQKKSRVN